VIVTLAATCRPFHEEPGHMFVQVLQNHRRHPGPITKISQTFVGEWNICSADQRSGSNHHLV